MAQKAGNNTCTMVFRDLDYDSGWTESWQTNIITIDLAMQALERVAEARVGMLSSRFNIEYLRVSAVQAPKVPPARNQRVAYLKRISKTGSLDPTGDGDLPFVAALIRFYNADKTQFALRLFRGLPDSFWANNDDKNAQTRMRQPTAALVAALVQNQMGFTHKNAAPPPAVTLTTVATGEFERLTRRATGRPLYLPRGRK